MMKPAYDTPTLIQPATGPAPEGETTVEIFDVVPCLTEIEVLVKNTWKPNVRFDLNVSLDMPVVTCCRASLRSAIINLLINARDSMPDGGVISLAAARHEEHGATEIEVRVTDTGHGMTTNTLLHAIDPFFTTKTTGLGGLGLPLVLFFVQEAGGRLHIESEPGVGTIVTLWLPILRPMAEDGAENGRSEHLTGVGAAQPRFGARPRPRRTPGLKPSTAEFLGRPPRPTRSR